MRGDRSSLRAALDRVEERGAAALRTERRQSAWRPALVRALPWCVYVPLMFLGYAVGRALGLWHGPPVAVLTALATAFGVALAIVLETVSQAVAADVDPRDALARVEREFDAGERLVTAHVFLGLRHRTPFMEAAIDDARAAVESAGRVKVLPRAPRRVPVPGRFRLPAMGVLLAILAASIDREAQLGDLGAAPPVETARRDAPTRRGATPTAEAPTPRVVEAPHPRKGEAVRKGAQETRADTSTGDLPAERKETLGTTGSGQSSRAAEATGASQSKGVPSGQGQDSEPAPERAKKKNKKPSKKPDAEDEGEGRKRPAEKSGSTAGSGSASGSNRNPSASEWSSKDRITDTEDDPVENDEEVDDEDSDSEARGGVQPTLRDRKPPANRDLQIGFGNRPNPDANGRGGPSQMKKSRGTASLVLGVPIPDHVKGQANPGRTKITQERVDPKEDEASAVDAGARSPRATPVRSSRPPALTPFLRALVRDYFTRLHERTEDSP